MKNKSRDRYIFSLFFLSTLFVATYAQTSEVVSHSILNQWGYRSISVINVEQSSWEQETFGEAKIVIQKIKSIKEVPDWAKAYYRFTLIEESYPSDAEARYRYDNILLHPPGIETKMHPEYILRKGINVGQKVYIISTDVLLFEREEMPKIEKHLQAYVE